MRDVLQEEVKSGDPKYGVSVVQLVPTILGSQSHCDRNADVSQLPSSCGELRIVRELAGGLGDAQYDVSTDAMP